MTYQETLNSHKAELLCLKSERAAIDLDDVFKPIDWQQPTANKAFFAFLKSERLSTSKDIEAARKRDVASRLLGKYPTTCCEYVGAYIHIHEVTVDFTGTIRAVDPARSRSRDLIITELARNIRVMAVELGLPFHRASIDDAVDSWYQDAREARVEVIRQDLEGEGSFDWLDLAQHCFDCADTSPAFIAAVLRKFIHQIKLKLWNRRVGHHLMPVLLGNQGCGKTTFIHALISPIAELSRDADFRMIADDRHISMWRSYALVIDEMAYADKSDIEIVKHVITAHAVDRRPMKTNDVVSIRQCATLIGASNKTLAELIRDETGLRRFIGLAYRADADWAYLNQVDWKAAWRSVSIEDADPMDEFRSELVARQAESRHVSPVEAWLSQLTSTNCTTASAQTAQISTLDLYNDYLTHFHARNDGQRPKTENGCLQEIGRLVAARPHDFRIEKKKTKRGNIWCWRANTNTESVLVKLDAISGRLAA